MEGKITEHETAFLHQGIIGKQIKTHGGMLSSGMLLFVRSSISSIILLEHLD